MIERSQQNQTKSNVARMKEKGKKENTSYCHLYDLPFPQREAKQHLISLITYSLPLIKQFIFSPPTNGAPKSHKPLLTFHKSSFFLFSFHSFLCLFPTTSPSDLRRCFIVLISRGRPDFFQTQCTFVMKDEGLLLEIS